MFAILAGGVDQFQAAMYLYNKAISYERSGGNDTRVRQRSRAIDSITEEDAQREFDEAKAVVDRLQSRGVWVPDRIRARFNAAKSALLSARERAFNPSKQCASLPSDVYDRFEERHILAATPKAARRAVSGELRRGKDTRERLQCASIEFAERCQASSDDMRERMHCTDEDGRQRTVEEAEAERIRLRQERLSE